jgi:membrane protein implicated in regulation of membrane protease activity
MSDAALARGSHSIASAIKAGFTLWYALTAGVVAWMIHLVGLAAMVRLTCNDPSWDWALHGLTVVTVAFTLVGLWLAWRLERSAHVTDDSTESEPSRNRFLGRIGLTVNAFSLALILLEEIYVVAFHSRACG